MPSLIEKVDYFSLTRRLLESEHGLAKVSILLLLLHRGIPSKEGATLLRDMLLGLF